MSHVHELTTRLGIATQNGLNEAALRASGEPLRAEETELLQHSCTGCSVFAHRRSVSSSWSLDLSHVAVVQSVNAMGVDLFQQGGEGGSKVSGARRLSGEPRHAAKATSGEDGARNNRRGMDGISNTVHPWYL